MNIQPQYLGSCWIGEQLLPRHVIYSPSDILGMVRLLYKELTDFEGVFPNAMMLHPDTWANNAYRSELQATIMRAPTGVTVRSDPRVPVGMLLLFHIEWIEGLR